MFKSEHSITYSVILVSVLGLVSKIIGLLREGVFSYYLGTSVQADDFFLVYGFLSNITTILGSSIGIAFLPIFLNNVEKKGEKFAVLQTSTLINQVFFISIPIFFFLYLFPDFWAHLIVPTYSHARQTQIANYIELFSIVVFFAIAGYIYASVLDAQKRYGISRIIGMSYSIVTILFIILFYRLIGLKALIYAVIVSYLIQYLISIMVLHCRHGYKLSIISDKDYNLKKVYYQTLPVFVGTGTLVIGQLIDRTVASTLESGSVAALSYSGTLHSLINTLLITSIVTVFYTDFSEKYIKGDIKGMMNTLTKGINILTLILTPVSVYCIVNSSDLITVLLRRGAFTQESVKITAIAFSFYLIGTTFFGIRNLLTRVFYAVGDTKTPLINGFLSILLNITFCVGFVFLLSTGVKGITFAASLTAIFSTGLLLWSLYHKGFKLPYRKVLSHFFQIIIIGIVVGLVLWLFGQQIKGINIFLRLIISFSLLVVLYVCILSSVRNEETRRLINFVKSKIIKS